MSGKILAVSMFLTFAAVSAAQAASSARAEVSQQDETANRLGKAPPLADITSNPHQVVQGNSAKAKAIGRAMAIRARIAKAKKLKKS